MVTDTRRLRPGPPRRPAPRLPAGRRAQGRYDGPARRPGASTRSCSSAGSRSRSTTCAATPRRRRTGARATRTATRSGSGSGSATSTSSQGAGDDQQAGESTPFYLYHRDARRRIAADLPDARLVAVLRDPVDRAYSNWMHLWVDGLEPCADIVEACAREQERIDERLGAVLALPRAGHVRPAGRGPVRALPARAGAAAALPRPRRRAATRRSTGCAASSGSPRTWSTEIPSGQLPALRAPRACAPGCSGRGAGRRAGRPVPAAAGLAQGRASR